MLKAFFLKLPESNVKEYIIEEKKFKKIKTTIKKALNDDDVIKCADSKSISKMCNKIPELNRTSFREIILNFCRTIELNVDDDIELFVKCRNELVHEGRFYCHTQQCKEKYPKLQTPKHEFLFLLNFVDKCFLRLLGYKGFYFDWSDPGNPEKKKLS